MDTHSNFTFHHLSCEEFRRYPWFANIDVDLLSTSRGISTLENLVAAIAENNVLRPYHPDDRLILDRLHLLPEPQLPSMPVASVLSSSNPQREYMFALFLFRYRVLDIALWIWKYPESKTSVEVTRTSLPSVIEITRFKYLNDWPGLVRTARNFCAHPPAPITADNHEFGSARLKHVGLYIRRTELQHLEAIFINFDTAALYLSHLLEGYSDLDRSNAPKALLDQLNKEPSVPLGRIKSPLQIALAVSPLALLIPTSHVSSSCGRPRMLEIWKALGSERPECIRLAERELWRALFDLSLSSTMDTRERLLTALDIIVAALHDVPPKRPDLVFFYTNPLQITEFTLIKPLVNAVVSEKHLLSRKEEEEEEEEENEADNKEQDEGLDNSTDGHVHGNSACNDQMSMHEDVTACNIDKRCRDEGTDLEMEEIAVQGVAGGERNGENGDEMDAHQDVPPPSGTEWPRTGEATMEMEGEGEGEPAPRMISRGGSPMNDGNITADNMDIDQDLLTPNVNGGHTAPATPMDTDGSMVQGEGGGDSEVALPVARADDIDMKEMEKGTTSSSSPVTPIPPRKKIEKGQIPPERQSARIANKPPASAPQNPAPLRPAPRRQKKVTSAQMKVPKQESKPRVTSNEQAEKEIIDLTLDEDDRPPLSLTIKTVETQLKVTAQFPSRLYGCMGLNDFLDYTPSFHYPEHLDWFKKVISAVEQSYSGGYPLHLADPDRSSIKILDFATFQNLSSEDLQAIFKKQHIVVHGYPCLPTEFNEKAMSYLAPSSKHITIHDLSVLPQSEDGDERHVVGVTGDLLKSHRSPHGKILNALDFPLPHRGIYPPETLATHSVAYHETLDDPYCSRSNLLPLSDLSWGLAATAHCFHYFHIDADGFGTHVASKTGTKYWVVAKPKPGKSFAATDMFINGDYAIDEMNTELFDVEAVVLTPGTCFFMQPNTPHLVLTPKASICHGGHFYSSSTLRSTCHGIFHTFIACSLLTNTEHTRASRELLRRFLYFYHKAFLSDYVVDGPAGKAMSPDYKGIIPDIFTFDGLLDVLSLCNLMELGNVIHHETYTEDGMKPSEMQRMIRGRAFSQLVRSWLEANIEIHHPQELPSLRSLDKDLFYPYLASQAVALLHYKKRAPSSGAQGHVKFTLQDLTSQINSAFFGVNGFQDCYKPIANIDPKTFDWTGTTYQVQPVNGCRDPAILDISGYMFDQHTFNDRKWLEENSKGGEGGTEDSTAVPKKRARV